MKTRTTAVLLMLALAACTESSNTGLCGPGTTLLDGVCTASSMFPCPIGQTLVGNACQVVSGGNRCGVGTTLQGTDCVADLPTLCGTDTVAQNQACVSALACGAGASRQGNLCVSTPAGITCGTGTVLQAQSCVVASPVTCGTGTRLSGSTCVASTASVTCGTGTTLNGSTCVPVAGGLSCGAGTAAVSNVCTVNLGTVCGTDTTGAGGTHCVGTLMCGANTTRTGSQCVGTTSGSVTCGAGTMLSGSQCVVAPTTGPLTTFLQSSSLATASYAPYNNSSYNALARRFVATELTQGNATAWANTGAPMIGTGRSLQVVGYGLWNVGSTAQYLTIEDATNTAGTACRSGFTPTTAPASGTTAYLSFFSWAAGVPSGLACARYGTVKVDEVYNNAIGGYDTRLTINAAFSDGSTLTDKVLIMP